MMKDGEGNTRKIRNQVKIAVFVLLLLTSAAAWAGCSNMSETKEETQSAENSNIEEKSAQIYLFGEVHGEEKVIQKEYEYWHQYYHEQGVRHLFYEMPYFAAQYLNLWMETDDDEIFEEFLQYGKGSKADNPYIVEFYQKIKSECPETIFHGIDVGHRPETLGAQYLNYLEENGLKDSQQYQNTLLSIEQGKKYEEDRDRAYRENMLAENFMREFDELGGESVMGIFGCGHVKTGEKDPSGKVPRMVDQLHEVYGDGLHSALILTGR